MELFHTHFSKIFCTVQERLFQEMYFNSCFHDLILRTITLCLLIYSLSNFICSGGSRVRLVCRMTKLSFLKKIDNFMKYKSMKEVSHGFLKKIQNSAKVGLRSDHREYFK